MTDWASIATAQGLNLPQRELDRVIGPLANLESSFRPLVETLTPADELDVSFRLEDE